ncbi:CapA family protein [Methylacidiphilum caldifontis]|uniref:Poly-gamma-glutamate biosynthesis protein n=2 Tax=Methylacidiphilum caldifontis TaxID=2795386 RepID=A0A4Y8PFZ9_9BACT|nr:poly-gamma-glutamate biosynthesis protein [Methylacidiphilum caldifontis]
MRIILVGDVMLGRLLNEVLEKEAFSYPWGDLLPLLRCSDWKGCNLECVFTDLPEPQGLPPKTFRFRSQLKNIEVLKEAGIRMVSLANNHVLDYGTEALAEMLDSLDAAGILHSGAGMNLAECSRPAIDDVHGFRIGFLAFTDNEPSWEATERAGGIHYVPVVLDDPRAQRLFKLVKKTKSKVDFLIVSAHWGSNWGFEVPLEHIDFAHRLIDSGADLVFGHSPHVFRAVEVFHGGMILYSCGDFIDDYAVDPYFRNDWSFVFLIRIERKKVLSLWLYPVRIDNFRAQRAKGREAKQIIERMISLCSVLGTEVHWEKEKDYCLIKV